MKPGFLGRLGTFVQERFEPLSHGLTILVFILSNVYLYSLLSGQTLSLGSLGLAGAVIVLVFFHMRLFDEVKDYETDCQVNPRRPLPRGLLSLNEVGAVTLSVLILEALVALAMGRNAFWAYTALAAYTLVMRQEFFIGGWLRPKMELYALVHTISAALMSWFLFTLVSGKDWGDMPLPAWAVGVSCWFIFNVYEFGRKTFGETEERDGVDSYSKRLGPLGALLLVLVNMVLGLGCLGFVFIAAGGFPGILAGGICALVCLPVVFFGILYGKNPTARRAQHYRNSVSAYLFLYQAGIVISGFLCTGFFPGFR